MSVTTLTASVSSFVFHFNSAYILSGAKKQRISQSWSENEIHIQTDTSTLHCIVCNTTKDCRFNIYMRKNKANTHYTQSSNVFFLLFASHLWFACIICRSHDLSSFFFLSSGHLNIHIKSCICVQRINTIFHCTNHFKKTGLKRALNDQIFSRICQ